MRFGQFAPAGAGETLRADSTPRIGPRDKPLHSHRVRCEWFGISMPRRGWALLVAGESNQPEVF